MNFPKLPKLPKLRRFPPPGPGELLDFGIGVIDAGKEAIDKIAAEIEKVGEGNHPDKDKLINRLNKEAREAKEYLRR